MRQDTRENLHRVIGRAGRFAVLTAPAANYRPDFFCAIKLSRAELSEILANAVEPWAPLVAGRLRKLLVFSARLVVGDHKTETVLAWRAPLFDRLVVGGDEFWRTRFAAQPRATTPRIPIGSALCRDLCNSLQVNLYHAAPRTLLTPGPVHQWAQ